MTTETKVTHTPGPWKYRMMGSEGARIFPDTGNMREDMKFIAMVNGRDFHADEANARLIVNAVNGYKELLEALERIRTKAAAMLESGKVSLQTLDAIDEIAEQAIAKADGK